MNRIDEKFTHIADAITEFVGRWWFSVLSLLVLIFWIIYGIFFIQDWFTSPVFNFPLNTVTTLGEWFLAALILAASNRVERRNQELLEYIKAHTEADLKTTRRVEQAIKEQGEASEC